MVKKNAYILLFFGIATIASYVVAMDKDHLSFLIKNPFDKQQKDEGQISLGAPMGLNKDNNFFVEQNQDNTPEEQRDSCFARPESKEVNLLILSPPIRRVSRMTKKVLYRQKFKKNDSDAFECPYNCPDSYTNKRGDRIEGHVKARHDKGFDLYTFDVSIADLDVYIPRKRVRIEKKYAEVLEKNEKGEFECPYDCPDDYAHKKGGKVAEHIQRRHDPGFNLQTFDLKEVNLNIYIPRKKKSVRGTKKHSDVFEKNEDGKFECPYNCPKEYTNKGGAEIVRHIKKRHDKNFNLQTFDHEKNDLNAYIPSKIEKYYVDVFEKNEDEQFVCPYNCPKKYVHKKGRYVFIHIKRRHDPEFNLQTFDRETADLDKWVSRKSKKRKRPMDQVSGNRVTKRRKTKI